MRTIAALCYVKILFSFGAIIDFPKKLKDSYFNETGYL
jgi:hypothetical protein